MNRLKALREKKGSIHGQMKEIADQAAKEERLMTEDENRQFDGWDKEFENIEKEIRRLEKLSEFEKPAIEPEPESNEKRYSQAFADYIKTGRPSQVLEERTTQSGMNTSTTTGGYLIPTALGDVIVKQLFTISDMLNYVTIKNTAGGGPIDYATRSDVSEKGHWLAEETQASQTLYAFGKKTLNALTLVSDIIPVSFQALQDSAFNFEQEILEVCTERLARGIDYALIQGGGTTDPNGLEAAATVQGAYMAKTAITRATMLDLIHSVNHAYRMSPSCKFVFTDTTLKIIKKLAISSTDDRSLWQPDFTTGNPGTIEGFGYVVNDNVDEFGASGRKPMYFGDLSQYYFRIVGGYNMQVFNEKYADFLQRGYMMWMRADGELMNTNAVKHAVCAAT